MLAVASTMTMATSFETVAGAGVVRVAVSIVVVRLAKL
jgi:hypothetical protein